MVMVAQDMSLPEVLEVSACGWLLSVLRYPYFQLGQSRRLFALSPRPSLQSSCSALADHGLDGTLEDLLYLALHSSVEEVAGLLGLTQFAARVRAKGQLLQLMEKYRASAGVEGTCLGQHCRATGANS